MISSPNTNEVKFKPKDVNLSEQASIYEEQNFIEEIEEDKKLFTEIEKDLCEIQQKRVVQERQCDEIAMKR